MAKKAAAKPSAKPTAKPTPKAQPKASPTPTPKAAPKVESKPQAKPTPQPTKSVQKAPEKQSADVSAKKPSQPQKPSVTPTPTGKPEQAKTQSKPQPTPTPQAQQKSAQKTSTPAITTPSQQKQQVMGPPSPAKYTVKPGDNLSTIGKKEGIDYKQITGYKSGNPNLIYPNEQVTLPKAGQLPPITPRNTQTAATTSPTQSQGQQMVDAPQPSPTPDITGKVASSSASVTGIGTPSATPTPQQNSLGSMTTPTITGVSNTPTPSPTPNIDTTADNIQNPSALPPITANSRTIPGSHVPGSNQEVSTPEAIQLQEQQYQDSAKHIGEIDPSVSGISQPQNTPLPTPTIPQSTPTTAPITTPTMTPKPEPTPAQSASIMPQAYADNGQPSPTATPTMSQPAPSQVPVAPTPNPTASPTPAESSLPFKLEMPTPSPSPTPDPSKVFQQPTEITQTYGEQSQYEPQSGGVNYGVDFGAQEGTPINLPEGKWRVDEAFGGAKGPGNLSDWTNQGYGNSAVFQNLDTGEKIRMSHMNQLDVKPGSVIFGGKVGNVGATGHTTGPHLDVEYYDKNGQPGDILQSPYAKAFQTEKPQEPAPTPGVDLGAAGQNPSAQSVFPTDTPKPTQAPSAQNPTGTPSATPTPDQIEAIVPESGRQGYKENNPFLNKAFQDEGIADPDTRAYALATIQRETAGTFKPIDEYGDDNYFKNMYEGRADLGNTQPGDGAKYHGRGFVQLTGRANYKAMGDRLGVDLENHPELALNPIIAAKAMAAFFKDRGVSDLAKQGDYVGARGPVNGSDQAENIANEAKKYRSNMR